MESFESTEISKGFRVGEDTSVLAAEDIAILERFNNTEAKKLMNKDMMRAYHAADHRWLLRAAGLARRAARMFPFYGTDMLYLLGLPERKEKRSLGQLMIRVAKETGGKSTGKMCRSIRRERHTGHYTIWESGLYSEIDRLPVPDGVAGDKLVEVFGRIELCL